MAFKVIYDDGDVLTKPIFIIDEYIEYELPKRIVPADAKMGGL